MEDLNMWHISVKYVPWLLTYKQKQWCVFVCQEYEVKNLPKLPPKDKTGVKICVYTYDPETYQHVLSVEKPVHSTSKEREASQLTTNSIFIWLCTVHQEFVPPYQIVNQHRYQEILQKAGASPWKHPEWWENQDWLIDQDKVLAHLAPSTKIFCW